jgi:hypothetical protein
MDVSFGIWIVRSTFRACSLRSVEEKISKHKLDLVRVQEVRQDGGGTKPADECEYFHGKENENHELGTVVCKKT